MWQKQPWTCKPSLLVELCVVWKFAKTWECGPFSQKHLNGVHPWILRVKGRSAFRRVELSTPTRANSFRRLRRRNAWNLKDRLLVLLLGIGSPKGDPVEIRVTRCCQCFSQTMAGLRVSSASRGCPHLGQSNENTVEVENHLLGRNESTVSFSQGLCGHLVEISRATKSSGASGSETNREASAQTSWDQNRDQPAPEELGSEKFGAGHVELEIGNVTRIDLGWCVVLSTPITEVLAHQGCYYGMTWLCWGKDAIQVYCDCLCYIAISS